MHPACTPRRLVPCRPATLSPPPFSPAPTSRAASFPAANEVLQAKQFSAKAAGYGAFILLLYFSLAALYCMCFMPFKQDTLLFGAKKTD